MLIYNTLEGQSIYDIAIQVYGDVSSAGKILFDNPQLVDINKTIPSGTALSYDEQLTDLTQFLIDQKIDISTTNPNEIEGKGYDSGYDVGFN